MQKFLNVGCGFIIRLNIKRYYQFRKLVAIVNLHSLSRASFCCRRKVFNTVIAERITEPCIGEIYGILGFDEYPSPEVAIAAAAYGFRQAYCKD